MLWRNAVSMVNFVNKKYYLFVFLFTYTHPFCIIYIYTLILYYLHIYTHFVLFTYLPPRPHRFYILNPTISPVFNLIFNSNL